MILKFHFEGICRGFRKHLYIFVFARIHKIEQKMIDNNFFLNIPLLWDFAGQNSGDIK